ncbi:hypothetical protein N9J72_00570 [Candidatus Gracilibacteria bacterium]|nr:hypothetical protein [Candidatus Gracilibacteria bacterium]
MAYITFTLLSGVFSGFLSIYFRRLELKNKIVLVHKQLITQIAVFTIFLLVFREFYSYMIIDLGFVKIGWFLIYFLFSSASFYAVQVFYENASSNSLFATEAEMKAYIEKIEKDKF